MSGTIRSARLQRVNGADDPFLYEITAGHRVRFKPGASDALVRLAPLIRPPVEVHWVRAGSIYTHVPEGVPLWKAEGGVERADPAILRGILTYCRR